MLKRGLQMNNVLKFRQRGCELPDDLVTVSEFIALHKHKCSKSYLYKLKNQNKIKFYPIGYYKFSEREALEAMGV